MKKHKIIIGGTVVLALLSINAQRGHVIVNADSNSIIDSNDIASITATTSSAVMVKTNSEVPPTIITDTKSEAPVLSPSSQLRPVEYWANTIYVTNDKQDTDYYYTSDGSTPNIFSEKVEINYEGRHVIYPNNSYSPKTIVIKVIAVEKEKTLSDIATATVTYAERTDEPIITVESKSNCVDMNKSPAPISVDKDNIKMDTDYYYSINDYGDAPVICDENKLKPNSDGEYIIQPPTLDLKHNKKLKITVIAVKKDMAPSYAVRYDLSYKYDEHINIKNQTQTVFVNENPEIIYLSQDSYTNNTYKSDYDFVYFRYTTDGSEPTMDNGTDTFFNPETKSASITIPTQSHSGTVQIKIRKVVKDHIIPMALFDNNLQPLTTVPTNPPSGDFGGFSRRPSEHYLGDFYMIGDVSITTINFVIEKVQAPILNPVTQTKYVGEIPEIINIENVSNGTKYFYTTDNSAPTISSNEITANENNEYKISLPTQTTAGAVNVKVIAIKNDNLSDVYKAEIIFKYKENPTPTPTPTPTPILEPEVKPTPTTSNSHHSHHGTEELKIVAVYKNDYVKNTNAKASDNNYTWNNTFDDLSGTLDYTDNCYTIKMDKDFDKGTHIIIYDNFKGQKAKLYSYLPNIKMYALLNEDVASTEGTLKFDTTHKGEYVITANALPKEKVLNYWFELGFNKWIFFNKYSDERLIGWHKADQGEWIHNGIDSVGDSFHMNTNTIMDMGWFKDSDGSWYYLDNLSQEGINSYGAVLKGWYYLNNNWYYFNLDNGKIITGWYKIKNNWYCFNRDGAMQGNTTIDGYQLNEHGQLI